jgi:DNA-binding MarR family transcriptional regulator
VAHVRETNEYSARKATDPFLTGTSRHVKDRCKDAAIVAGGTYQEWLASVPKGLGETCLRVLDAIHRYGAMTVPELADITGKTTGSLWRACRRLELEGLLLASREHQRAPKVYELAPDVWQRIEQLAPALRTHHLSVERVDRHLKESQQWTAKQRDKAIVAGDQELVAAFDKRLMRLGNQRMRTLATLSADKPMAQAELAQLAFDVRIPTLPHPGVMAKLRRYREIARMDVAETKRLEQWNLANLARTLRSEGINKKEAVRMLQLAGYTPKEAWGAVYPVWSIPSG